jgi:hypothetical protein
MHLFIVRCQKISHHGNLMVISSSFKQFFAILVLSRLEFLLNGIQYKYTPYKFFTYERIVIFDCRHPRDRMAFRVFLL